MEPQYAPRIFGYWTRRGLVNRFENVIAQWHPNFTANQFEQALVDLAQKPGYTAERFDDRGQWPDIPRVLPQKAGFIIEAKSRKLKKNLLTKENHGQLSVISQWFNQTYPAWELRVFRFILRTRQPGLLRQLISTPLAPGYPADGLPFWFYFWPECHPA